eukprot:jgi/Mesen1/9936/ME000070S09223
MATLDFNKVNWFFLLAVTIGKIFVFVVAIGMTVLLDVGKPSVLGTAGVHAIFVSQSNDFAMGLPILQILEEEEEQGGARGAGEARRAGSEREESGAAFVGGKEPAPKEGQEGVGNAAVRRSLSLSGLAERPGEGGAALPAQALGVGGSSGRGGGGGGGGGGEGGLDRASTTLSFRDGVGAGATAGTAVQEEVAEAQEQERGGVGDGMRLKLPAIRTGGARRVSLGERGLLSTSLQGIRGGGVLTPPVSIPAGASTSPSSRRISSSPPPLPSASQNALFKSSSGSEAHDRRGDFHPPRVLVPCKSAPPASPGRSLSRSLTESIEAALNPNPLVDSPRWHPSFRAPPSLPIISTPPLSPLGRSPRTGSSQAVLPGGAPMRSTSIGSASRNGSFRSRQTPSEPPGTWAARWQLASGPGLPEATAAPPSSPPLPPAQRASGGSSKLWKVFHNVISSPVVFMTIGASFSALSLFILGMSMADQAETAGEDHARLGPLITALALIGGKGVLLPVTRVAITSEPVLPHKQACKREVGSPLVMMGLVYGALPCSPATYFFAAEFGLCMEYMAMATVLGTFLFAPLVYVIAQLAFLVEWAAWDMAIISAVGAIWTLVALMVKKQEKDVYRMHHRIGESLICCIAAAACVSSLTCQLEVGPALDMLRHVIGNGGRLAARVFTGVLALTELCCTKLGPDAVNRRWWAIMGGAWGYTLVATAVPLLLSRGAHHPHGDTDLLHCWFPYKLPQFLIFGITMSVAGEGNIPKQGAVRGFLLLLDTLLSYGQGTVLFLTFGLHPGLLDPLVRLKEWWDAYRAAISSELGAVVPSTYVTRDAGGTGDASWLLEEPARLRAITNLGRGAGLPLGG